MTIVQTLPRSSPLQEGVDPAAIARCLDAIQSQAGQELHSIMILRHGQVIAEASWQPYKQEQPAMLFSHSKSFTSTAVGFAVAAGLLTVDDPVLSFFPDEAPARPGKYWTELKVRHLLSMNTGHETDTTSSGAVYRIAIAVMALSASIAWSYPVWKPSLLSPAV